MRLTGTCWRWDASYITSRTKLYAIANTVSSLSTPSTVWRQDFEFHRGLEMSEIGFHSPAIKVEQRQIIRRVARRVEQRGDQRDLRHTQSAAADPATRLGEKSAIPVRNETVLHRATLDTELV